MHSIEALLPEGCCGGGLVSQGREKPNGQSQAGDIDGAADSVSDLKSKRAAGRVGAAARLTSLWG